MYWSLFWHFNFNRFLSKFLYLLKQPWFKWESWFVLLCSIGFGMNIQAFFFSFLFFFPSSMFSLLWFSLYLLLFSFSSVPLPPPPCCFCFGVLFLSSLFQVFLSPSGFPTGWIKMVQLCPASSSSCSSGRALLRCRHCQPPVSSPSQRVPLSAS